MTRPELIESSAPKMEGQFLAWRPMSYFTKKKLVKQSMIFKNKLDPLDYVEI